MNITRQQIFNILKAYRSLNLSSQLTRRYTSDTCVETRNYELYEDVTIGDLKEIFCAYPDHYKIEMENKTDWDGYPDGIDLKIINTEPQSDDEYLTELYDSIKSYKHWVEDKKMRFILKNGSLENVSIFNNTIDSFYLLEHYMITGFTDEVGIVTENILRNLITLGKF